MPDTTSTSASSGAVVDSRSGGENERRILQRDRNPHIFRPIRFRSTGWKVAGVLKTVCVWRFGCASWGRWT